MLFVLVTDGVPTSMTADGVRRHLGTLNTSPPGDLTLADLTQFGIFPMALTTKPTPTLDEVVTEAAPLLVNGVWAQQWAVTAKPMRDTMRKEQWRAALTARGRWDSFLTYLAARPVAVQLAWLWLDNVEREGAEVADLQTSTGLTNAQINAVFRF